MAADAFDPPRPSSDRVDADTGERASQEQLRLALEIGRLGTWTLDTTTFDLVVSDTCKANYGRAPADSFRYADLATIVVEEDRARWRETVAAAVERGGPFEIEYGVRWPDGAAHAVLVRGSCITDESGKVVRMLGVSADMTAQRREREHLLDARQRLEATLAAAEVGTWTWDLREDRVVADRNLARLFSVSDADARGGPISAYAAAIHPDDREEAATSIQRAIDDHERYEARYRVRGADGLYRMVVARGHAEYGPGGEALRLPGVVIDVSREERASAELRESEERYRNLFNAIEDGFCILEKIEGADGRTVDFRYLEANPAFLPHSGLAGAVGQTIRAMVGEEADEWIAIYDRVLRTGESIRFARELIARQRFLEIYALPMPDVDRRRVAVLFKDVSARETAGQALRTNEERLRRVIQATGAGTWEVDLVSRRLLADEGLRTLHGYVGQGAITLEEGLAVIHPDDREGMRAGIAAAMAGERRGTYHAEYRALLPNGEARWIEARGLATFDAAGAVVRFSGTGVDATIRKRAEIEREELLARTRKAQAEAEAERLKLNAIFEQSPIAIAILEGASHVFTFANPSYRALLGGRDVVGTRAADALHDATDFEFVSRLDHVVATGEPYFGQEIALKRASDSEPLYVNVSYKAKRDPLGQIDGVLVSVVDITHEVQARRRVEEGEAARALVLEQSRVVERELRREAEDANRAKDEFLAMLGHEMRNPLAPITTALDLMKLRADKTFVKERTIIERQVEHLTRLVDDLLDVSRITSGKITIQRETLNVATVVANAIEIASPLIEQRRHHLFVAVPPHDLWVEGDATRLAQVIANLLTNAAKYTETTGGRIDVVATHEADEVVIRVRDNGVGIAPEMLPRVFGLFVQERQSLDRAQGGLGLGLTIVRTLVAMHGGTVTAASAGRAQGSEFTIRLPAAKAIGASPPSARSAASLPPVRKVDARRVLVVDDNADAAELLATTLEYLGHEARVAHDGPSALAVVESFTPDLAVLDIGLPVMDGYELGRRLREIPRLAHLRLVALTGYGQTSDKEQSARAGFQHHMVKPLQLEELQAIVEG